MTIVAVLPARMGSSRFPGKPLAPILGRPMIEHVYHRTAMTPGVDAVYVATCDQEIVDAVEGFGGQAVMTSPLHQRASDRSAEAIRKIGNVDIALMVQGDEPMITPEMVALSLAPMLDDPDVLCTNLTKRITDEKEFEDPNCIKVVIGRDGYALYFSREPIPTRRMQPFGKIQAFKQVCVIPFRAWFLQRFIELEPTPLEIVESIDMMRILEHGFRVKMVETIHESHAVDTPEDLRLVGDLMRHDPLTARYMSNL